MKVLPDQCLPVIVLQGSRRNLQLFRHKKITSMSHHRKAPSMETERGDLWPLSSSSSCSLLKLMMRLGRW